MPSNKFNLSQEKFNKLIKQSEKLHPKRCKCGGSASIKIHFAFYGPVGVRIECNHCERVGEMARITEFIGTEDKAGTPVTEKSLMKGIKIAVKLWKGK